MNIEEIIKYEGYKITPIEDDKLYEGFLFYNLDGTPVGEVHTNTGTFVLFQPLPKNSEHILLKLQEFRNLALKKKSTV